MKFDDRPVSQVVADMFEEDWKKENTTTVEADKDTIKACGLENASDGAKTEALAAIEAYHKGETTPYTDEVEETYLDEEYTTVEAEYADINKRLDTIDAVMWTREFAKTRARVMLEKGEDIADDEGTMLGWFANSIMKGYDHGLVVGEENGYAVAVDKKDQSDAIELNEEIDRYNNRLNRIFVETAKVVDIQSQDGNWNFDPYMHGMLNGMKLIQSIIHDVEPEFADGPEEWLKEDPKQDEMIKAIENADIEKVVTKWVTKIVHEKDYKRAMSVLK